MITNSMTDFDKLIREKAEQAEYPYTHSAWKKFQRKSGIKFTSARYWTLGISSALVVGGIVAYFGYQGVNHTPSNTESPQSESSVDTITQTIIPETDNHSSETYLISESDIKTSKKQVIGKEHSEKAVDSVSETPRKRTTSHVANPPRYGRPLVIDVDTIKDNVPTDEELKQGNSRLY